MSDIVVSSPEVVTPTPLSTSTTLATYIEFCKQYLYTGTHEIRDKLATTIDSAATTLTVTYGNTAFQDGIRVSCELEDMYVWDVSGKTLTLERGQFGTVSSSHLASSMIYASPKFSDAEILREINREIQSLSAPGAGLFQVRTIDIVSDGSVRAYDFSVIGAMDILDIRVRTPGTAKDWISVHDWEYNTNSYTTDFASGYALFINDPLPTGTTLHVVYSLPFSTISSLTDVVTTTTGLNASQLDLPILGAAINLTAGRDIKRNFDETQGETRRADEVPPGANITAANALRSQYRRRRVEEANRLQKQFPTRKYRLWDIS